MNTKSILNTLTIVLVTSSISAFAIAKDKGPGAKKMLKHLDTDGDGQISMEEFKPPKRTPFGKADVNDDGIVTMEEIEEQMAARHQERESANEDRRAAAKAMLAAHFAEMDTNGDGGLTTDEIKQGIFSRMDENQDGYITKDEMKRPERMGQGKGKRYSRGH